MIIEFTRMKKLRIVKRTHVNGSIDYQIQKKGWLTGWNDVGGCDRWSDTSFATLREAQKNLCYWDSSKTQIEIIKEYNND